MPEMKFWYKEFPLAQTDVFGRKKLYRPIIPVTIEYSGKKVGYEALLDSDIPQKSNGALGHFGFFDHFVVRLETNKREVEVKKI